MSLFKFLSEFVNASASEVINASASEVVNASVNAEDASSTKKMKDILDLKDSYLHEDDFFENMKVKKPKHHYLLLLMHLLNYMIPFRGFRDVDDRIDDLNNALHAYFENDCSSTRTRLLYRFLDIRKFYSKEDKIDRWRICKEHFQNSTKLSFLCDMMDTEMEESKKRDDWCRFPECDAIDLYHGHCSMCKEGGYDTDDDYLPYCRQCVPDAVRQEKDNCEYGGYGSD